MFIDGMYNGMYCGFHIFHRSISYIPLGRKLQMKFWHYKAKQIEKNKKLKMTLFAVLLLTAEDYSQKNKTNPLDLLDLFSRFDEIWSYNGNHFKIKFPLIVCSFAWISLPLNLRSCYIPHTKNLALRLVKSKSCDER